MLRIGIIGSDNSHAAAFAGLVNEREVLGADARVTALWGQEEERTAEVASVGRIPEIVDEPTDLLGRVDAVLVVTRHGSLHAQLALPFLERGVPTFVDKPFAADLEDARRMVAAAEASGAPLTSFSTLRFAPATRALHEEASRIGDLRAAHVGGPCDFDSPYDGPFFYANHVLEVALRIMGEDVERVDAARIGRTVSARLHFGDGKIACLTFLGDAARRYHGTFFGSEGLAHAEIRGGDESVGEGVRIMYETFRGGASPLGADQMLRPVAIVEALLASLERGGTTVDLPADLAPRAVS